MSRRADDRSYRRISRHDLARLSDIARADLASLFRRRSATGQCYRNRLIAIALCQGSALHYVDRKNGVKDFDVWTFFRAHPKRPFPYRRNASADFGSPKFGRSPGCEHYVGRRVDLLGRSLATSRDSPVEVLRHYLAEARTVTAKELRKKAVVLLYPPELIGTVVWPLQGVHNKRIAH